MPRPWEDNRHRIQRHRPHNQGPAHPQSKLTVELVVRMRALYNADEKIVYIHALLAPWASLDTVGSVVRRESWTCVPWWLEWTIPYGGPHVDTVD